jgi:hypothetical protein
MNGHWCSIPRVLRVVSAPLALAWAATTGCASRAPTPHDLEVEVRAEEGVAVSGAQLRVRGDYHGTTNPLGRATLRVPASPGERLPVALTCPPGFIATPPEQVVTLPEGARAADPIRVAMSCKAEQHDAVVIVHATAPASLPVLVDGVPVGQTDALGFAHVHVRAASDSPFEVSLDTSSNAKLQPANPSRRFQLEARDEVFVFDTTFEAARPSKKARTKRRARGT